MPWFDSPAGATPDPLELLEGYAPREADEQGVRREMLRVLLAEARPFARNAPRHFTASAVVLDGARRVLLVRHPRLGRWVQPGGHLDGSPDLAAAAWREVEEESGLRPARLRLPPLHLERFAVPPTAQAPGHTHLDVAFLMEAPAADPPAAAARWFPAGALPRLDTDDSLRRRVGRALEILGSGSTVRP